MSQKEKIETSNDAGRYMSETVIEALWNQYDFLLQSLRTSEVEGSDAYEHYLKEMKAFFKKYKETAEGLFHDQKKLSKDLAEHFAAYEQTFEFMRPTHLSNKSTEQLEDIQRVYENTALIPWNFTVNFAERIGERLEENSKESLVFIKENHQAWEKITTNYLEALKNNQLAFAKGIRAFC
ncbi:hypothetical protein GN156_09110 [bacterium LRH843]|nr:hypothetical protein [bacterium LRH843]